MVTKTAEEAVVEQEEIVVKAPEIKVPEEVQEKAEKFVGTYVSNLKKSTEAYVERKAAEIEIGTQAGDYSYINCLTIGPIQFITPPPYRPHKIVTAGEVCLMVGVIWLNPASDGEHPPATIQLNGRNWRARFESINLTTVANGPDATFAGIFAGGAPIIPLYWWMPTPNPGINPHLIEVNLTVDILDPLQPYAAFSTWHYDLDREPAFFLPPRPDMPPHWQFERPARYLLHQ